nr:uncharacterized protein LOC113404600 [Vanessa tameamea]
MEKSIMTPTRLINFLGIRWDTKFNTKSLPLEKIKKIQNISQRTPIHPQRMATNHVITDASDIQWGALVNNEMVKGSWEHHQSKWHCNLKEMYAVIAAIFSRATLLQHSRVILQCDNRTLVSYIKNEGGTRSRQLLDLTQKLLALVDHLNVVLLPHHLPGLYNTEADHLSRNRAGSEWHLTEEATMRLFSLWGIPDRLVRVSDCVHVVTNYITLDLLDSNACFHDSFSRSWHYRLAWLFPPPSLIPRVIGHLKVSLSLRSVHTSGTQVEEALLEARPESTGPQTTRKNQRSEHLSGGTMTMIPPAQSTIRTYAPIWNKWVRFCQKNSINSRVPEPSNVARYLGYLYLSHGICHRTFLVYKSVKASVCETISAIKIASSPIVKHILKAISLAKPPPPKLPIWDARILIRFLKNYIIDLNSVYQISMHTVAILLLPSGRRVHDLTLLHVDSEHFIDNVDSITLHPIFGSKTDSSSYQQSSWTFVAVPDRNINAVYWLRTLVNMTQQIRRHISNLFLAIKGPTRPATAAMIGGWIKGLLADSGIQASAGSCRAAVSSLNWVENYHINDILPKGNWKHEHTFKKFYQKHIINTPNAEITAEKSLSQYLIYVDLNS